MSKKQETLVYADLGPLSFGNQACASTLDIGCNRVEYTQVNCNVSNKFTTSCNQSRKEEQMKESHLGMCMLLTTAMNGLYRFC